MGAITILFPQFANMVSFVVVWSYQVPAKKRHSRNGLCSQIGNVGISNRAHKSRAKHHISKTPRLEEQRDATVHKS